MGIMLNQEQLNKIHKIELICLDELVRICDKHNINYFLIGGTLIGAIRHKGFIPWDDDIDITMFRKDYERFISICKDLLKFVKQKLIQQNSFYKFQKQIQNLQILKLLD